METFDKLYQKFCRDGMDNGDKREQTKYDTIYYALAVNSVEKSCGIHHFGYQYKKCIPSERKRYYINGEQYELERNRPICYEIEEHIMYEDRFYQPIILREKIDIIFKSFGSNTIKAIKNSVPIDIKNSTTCQECQLIYPTYLCRISGIDNLGTRWEYYLEEVAEKPRYYKIICISCLNHI